MTNEKREIRMTAEEMSKRVYFCVEPKRGIKDYYHQEALDLDAYIRVFISATESFRLPENMMDDAMLIAAQENTEESIKIQNLASILGDAVDVVPMDIVSTDTMMFGASALLFPGIFKKYCEDKRCRRLYIIPSSVHELLVLNADMFGDASGIAEIIRFINATEVKEPDVLADHIYQYDYVTNEITF